jgi:hypothetical protein
LWIEVASADDASARHEEPQEQWMTTTFSKRNKEKVRQERQREKALERQRRKVARDAEPPPEPGVDPDIAHIIPGPQPIEEGF